MTKSRLNGNKNGLGFYELMTAPKRVYGKALATAERNNIEEFCALLGIDKSERRVKNEDY